MHDSEKTRQILLQTLQSEFGPKVEVEDQSYQHAGHKAAGGGGHFFAVIHSARFRGLGPLARQRLVLDLVKPLMDKEIHALSMRCVSVED